MVYRVELEKQQSGTTHDGYCSDAETYPYSKTFTEVIEVSKHFVNNYVLPNGKITRDGLDTLRVNMSGCDTGGSGYCGCETNIICLSGRLLTE